MIHFLLLALILYHFLGFPIKACLSVLSVVEFIEPLKQQTLRKTKESLGEKTMVYGLVTQ